MLQRADRTSLLEMKPEGKRNKLLNASDMGLMGHLLRT